MRIEGNKIEMRILPHRPLPDDWPIRLNVMNRDGKTNQMVVSRVPIMTIHIEVPATYPSKDPPDFKIEGFYHKYEDQLK